MAANQEAAGYVYANYGYGSELASTKEGAAQVYENYGYGSELVSPQEGAAQIYENLSINPTDQLRTLVDRHAIGWGVTPYKTEQVSVLLSDEGSAYVYENIT